MLTHRYTVEQVLAGIQSYARDHFEDELEIDPDAPVYSYNAAIQDLYGCPLEFLPALARHFELDWRAERWVVWLKLPRQKRPTKHEAKKAWEEWEATIGKTLTVRDLAAAIAVAAPGISLAPVTVFGSLCAPAGAFLGIAEMPELRSRRVTPSCKVAKHLSGLQLRGVWSRTQWMTGQKLPSLRGPRLAGLLPAMGWAAFVATTWVVSYLFWRAEFHPASFWLALLAGGWAAVVCYDALNRIDEWLWPRLPASITTFRDLAKYLTQASS